MQISLRKFKGKEYFFPQYFQPYLGHFHLDSEQKIFMSSIKGKYSEELSGENTLLSKDSTAIFFQYPWIMPTKSKYTSCAVLKTVLSLFHAFFWTKELKTLVNLPFIWL